MNQFKFAIDNDNMAITPIENIFINHYMPQAHGDYVKVYLFGLKHCFNQSLDPIDNLELSRLFNLTEGDVIKAWEYWEKEGILSLEYVGAKDVVVTYYNISARLMNSQKSQDVQDEAPEIEASPANQMEARIADMYERVQQMYGSRTITQKEITLFRDWISDYHFTPETIVLLVEYSMNLIAKKERPFTTAQIISYISRVAEAWHKADIRDYAQADAYIKESRDTQKLYYDVFHYLGLKRNPIAWEKALMSKWRDEYHYDMDIITYGMSRSSKTDLRYIDAILKRWHDQGLTTLEAIEKNPGAPQRPDKNTAVQNDQRAQAHEALDQADAEWLRSLYNESE
ncbi:MAG: DnaD domain protein [Eubacterium sp.]|nr:DnaD domain protein [Eubacterium sp.]